MDYLLERLQKLDKEISEAERALTHLNKQVGSKMSKLSRLNEERRKVSEQYKEIISGVSSTQRGNPEKNLLNKS